MTPRVNSARMPDFQGQVVRLTGKVLRLSDASNEAVLQASDGGEVRVVLSNLNPTLMTDAYVEVVGKVAGNDELRALATIDLGNELDMGLVNYVVERYHDPRFASLV
ncbi:uncharacterized protein PHACADRAFT_246128 [Phanerochaete carnosa HHB-10118-sp]|uniref:Replication factor A protein 3 n=1 Tax=Phanerochaete carnosa (strain HHB-10118-sp) TaxID=650164 RepID=K5W8I6_PHACS|nr:uncharacterized protein PHACADRAFT_246128 [Phanerochaete carnosa HHB-10118-sp]EKM60258.1 hypothetical protein PHACADRAFT_246128 [Phanerochaete carnosa HHB-10118-sp]